jgi:3-(3-hydroxy-phenyl)propionate hydroxylase
VREANGIVAAWFARHGACAALVRPDHYVYGVAAAPAEIAPLVESFSDAAGAKIESIGKAAAA